MNITNISINRDELLATVRWDASGLVPVIAQNADGTVLMLAYMNAESLSLTLDTGYATYWSRSRQRLWKKGETSGHTQRVSSIAVDCDGDSLLLQVDQTGAACHTGEKVCFYRILDVVTPELDEKPADSTILREVFDVIRDRAASPKPGSYTNYLLDKGVEKISKKIGEEASETIIAAVKGAPDEVRYEAADLMYHLLVLLYQQGLTPEDIFAELAGRHKG
ncbi:histidine biosynthesis bifunctional protein HisIE [Clostridia bacterium]|nr:histidine biosynthesis bifunctional protein HisIE [Clostridia bacterium]